MSDPKVIPLRRWKQISSLFAILVLLYLLHLVLAPTVLPVSLHYEDLVLAQRPSWPTKSSHSQESLSSLVLNERQCAGKFPGLFEDINTTIALGPFTLKPSGEAGPLQLRLQDGQASVHIFCTPKKIMLTNPPTALCSGSEAQGTAVIRAA